MAQKQKELLREIKIVVDEWRDNKIRGWKSMDTIMNMILTYEEKFGKIIK